MPDVLSDKTYKTYKRLSRYNNFPYFYHKVDDKNIYGITDNLSNTTEYANYVVKKGDSLDTIALEAYNDPTNYWVIADYNRIQDPLSPLQVGQVIKVPVISNIQWIH